MDERQRPTLLVVDDEPGNLKILYELLKGDYAVKAATSGEKALALARMDGPLDLILLDVVMPGIDGYEVCRRLKADEATGEIPVIFITGKISEEDEVRGFEAGAVDYVTKPFSPVVVKARVHNHISLKLYRDLLVEERAQTERLLLSILPANIARELKETGTTVPIQFDQATVMFTDFVAFSDSTKAMNAIDLIMRLNAIFSAFDDIIARHSLERLKTIGDSYMCIGGVPTENTTNAVDVCLAALEIRTYIETMRAESGSRLPFRDIRIGINTGPLIAGVIGHTKFSYDVWGDDVNIASQMESAALPGSINISESTWKLVREYFETESRGVHAVKNGRLLPMHTLRRLRPEFSADEQGVRAAAPLCSG